MGDAERPNTTAWLSDPLARRAVLGLFGLSAIAAACSSDGSATGSTGSSSSSPTTSTAVTAQASTTTAVPAATVAQTTLAPPETTTTTATTTTATTSEGTTAAPPATVAPTTSAPPASIVRGSNVNVTAAVLRSDSEAYGGAWKGDWSWTDGSGSGLMTATGKVDVDARLITGLGNITGSIVSSPIPEIAVSIDVDSWTYDNDGNFTISFPTAIGVVTLSSNGGFGKFKLHVDIVGRDDVVSFDATGVANRPSAIPVSFTMTARDGSTKSGAVTFRPT